VGLLLEVKNPKLFMFVCLLFMFVYVYVYWSSSLFVCLFFCLFVCLLFMFVYVYVYFIGHHLCLF